MSTHINIVNLLDSIDTSDEIGKFEKEEDLATYTRATKRYYSLCKAKVNGLLKVLLRHINSPIPKEGSKHYRP